ncbi:MAG: hypothetical protein ABJF88_15295 [Rhodothermales bacterium]
MSVDTKKLSFLRKTKRQLVYWKRDLSNIIRYGIDAPRHLELIYVNPRECTRFVQWEVGSKLGLHHSGRVVNDVDWDSITRNVAESGNIIKLKAHWIDGVPWEELSNYQYMLRVAPQRPNGAEGCFTREDVVARYRRLDEMFEEAKRTGRLKTRGEIDPTALREEGGVLMNIGPGGELIFGEAGVHRFTVAWILRIPLPCVIGAVDRCALDHYPKFREMPSMERGTVLVN